MAVYRDTIRRALIAAVPVALLTLTGIFGVFEGRDVIDGLLNLSQIALILMLGGTGFLIASHAREHGPAVSIVNAMMGSGIVGVVLALLVIFDSQVDLSFVFQNLNNLSDSTLVFGRPVSFEGQTEITGLLILLGVSLALGALAGILVHMPRRARDILLMSIGLAMVVGLARGQINGIISLVDALALTLVFGVGYAASRRTERPLFTRAGIGFAAGVALGLALTLMANLGVLGFNRQTDPGDLPMILGMALSGLFPALIVLMGLVGVVGALMPIASRPMHNGMVFLVVGLIVLGIVFDQRDTTLPMMLAVVAVLYAAFWFVPLLGDKAEALFETHPPSDQRVIGGAFAIGTMVVLLVAPMFMGTYISNVFNLVALYAIMGIGLNVMIGYTGLLDLGYVASYAIGAYTLGILTSPSLLTCGGADPSNIFNPAELAELCTNTLTFWQALPFCVLVSATTGMLLGVPVLRLRGDYLAIVTLGFGEITNRIILSNDFKPLLGGAQGVAPIPSPVINLSAINSNWLISFNDSSSIYYLFLASVALTALIVGRLVFMRTGRAWRAIRADEDVAQAMGINLMNYKLLAFGISSAFAGLGGAVFGASLQGIFPNSFTIFVSINVLSLIIIGGMGSIPGVIVGALILVGLPELLRELDAYRLLTFGTLLVAVMVLKPDGLIPPQPPELSERAEQSRRGKEPSHA